MKTSCSSRLSLGCDGEFGVLFCLRKCDFWESKEQIMEELKIKILIANDSHKSSQCFFICIDFQGSRFIYCMFIQSPSDITTYIDLKQGASGFRSLWTFDYFMLLLE